MCTECETSLLHDALTCSCTSKFRLHYWCSTSYQSCECSGLPSGCRGMRTIPLAGCQGQLAVAWKDDSVGNSRTVWACDCDLSRFQALA